MHEDGIRVVAAPEKVHAIALATVQQFGWTVTSVSGTSIAAKTGITVGSWGEVIEILIQPLQRGSHVTVRSTAKAQLIDWGKSEENVATVLAYLRANLE